MLQDMTPGALVTPIIEENLSRDGLLIKQGLDLVQGDQEGFARPSLTSNPRHFMKMYQADKPAQKDSEWIGRRISEL